MAFVKKTWKDRIVQYANRRLLTKSGGEVEQVTVTRDEGTISEAGDRFDAATMNNLEKRVKDAFDDLNAADLPISSSDTTNTKDYIDTEKVANTASYLYTPTVTEPTLDSGASHNNRTWYYKHGTRVCMSIGVKSLNTGVFNQDLFSLPVGYRPRNTLSLVCSGYSFDKKSVVIILADGTVRVTATEDQGAFAYIEFDAYS